MNVPGITSPDMSATINAAVKAGWVYVGTAKNHTTGQIVWPATGAVVKFSTTPKSGGWKTTAQMIYAASGVDLRRKGGGARRSRTACRPSGFSLARSSNDPVVTSRIDSLCKTHEAQRVEWQAITAAPSRENASRARVLLTEIAAVESELHRLHQPVDRIAAA